jgi:DNA-binding HxlR family transcriptional regulator
VTLLQGVLADRDAWSAIGECSIEKTMSVLGTKSAMLIMREAYYGTTRFDDFARRVGITKAAASARLSELVDLGLLTRRPYREPGQRTRDEYVLTEAGIDFMPVVWAMRLSRRCVRNRAIRSATLAPNRSEFPNGGAAVPVMLNGRSLPTTAR